MKNNNMIFVLIFITMTSIIFIGLLMDKYSKENEILIINDVNDVENKVIIDYLEHKVMKPGSGGKVFSVYKLLSRNSKRIYIWASMEEYYKEDETVLLGTSWTIPLVLKVREVDRGIEILKHTAPRDGDLYGKDIRRLFPKRIQSDIWKLPSNSDQIKNLRKQREERVIKWFGEK